MELTIHDVKSINAEPIRDGDAQGAEKYTVRVIIITYKDGREFRLTLFSNDEGGLGVRSVV